MRITLGEGLMLSCVVEKPRRLVMDVTEAVTELAADTFINPCTALFKNSAAQSKLSRSQTVQLTASR